MVKDVILHNCPQRHSQVLNTCSVVVPLCVFGKYSVFIASLEVICPRFCLSGRVGATIPLDVIYSSWAGQTHDSRLKCFTQLLNKRNHLAVYIFRYFSWEVIYGIFMNSHLSASSHETHHHDVVIWENSWMTSQLPLTEKSHLKWFRAPNNDAPWKLFKMICAELNGRRLWYGIYVWRVKNLRTTVFMQIENRLIMIKEWKGNIMCFYHRL